MLFASDNTAGAAPEVLAALAEANRGTAPAYGGDEWTARLAARLAEIFEHPVDVYPVPTGTGANALALGALVPPYGAVLCHHESHVHCHETGAPELYTGGAKLLPVGGDHGKVDPAALVARLERRDGPGGIHEVQPAALSLTQLSELGTAYTAEETAELAAIARRHGLAVHVDGARFANAAVASPCSPADLTWRAGVDVLSLGGTKNGALAAEAVVFFREAPLAGVGHRRKRGGLLCSKHRFLAAQLLALFADDLWLRLADHANAQAARLAEGLRAVPEVEILHPVDGNILFLRAPAGWVEALAGEGFPLLASGDREWRTVRLVTAFDTDPAVVGAFLAAAGRPARTG